MLAVVLIALILTVAIQGRIVNTQGQKILSLETTVRRLNTANVQMANVTNRMVIELNKSLSRLERDVADLRKAGGAGRTAAP
jgi:hypothetical protein